MDESGRGRRVKNGGNNVDDPNEFEIELNPDAIFVIKLPDSRSLRVISRSLFLAVVLLALPSIGSIIGANSYAPPLYDPDADSDSYTSNWIENLPALLHDLMEEGLIRKGHKGFVLGSGIRGIEDDLRDAGVDLVAGAGAHRVFDYIYAPSFSGIELMDGAVKDGGLAIAPLAADLSAELRLLRSFKIVYLRRLGDNTVVAMRKSAALSGGAVVKQCGIAPEKKKEAALRGLEDVYLEPPRPAKKSGFTSRKIRFLPDLMKDPLDEYPRRVFIADDANALDWFYKNYLMRGQEFEVYDMEGQEREGDWIAKTGVKAEDYVVVKAEAGVVEQMLRDNTLCVVDELFLECRNGSEEEEEEKGRRRAYWECVALYGRVRDEGIAVHQWW